MTTALFTKNSEIYKNCTLLCFYGTSSSNLFPIFRDNLWVQFSGFKNQKWNPKNFGFLNPKDGTDKLSRNVGKKSQLFLTFIGPCIVMYSYSTTNKMYLFLNLFILV